MNGIYILEDEGQKSDWSQCSQVRRILLSELQQEVAPTWMAVVDAGAGSFRGIVSRLIRQRQSFALMNWQCLREEEKKRLAASLQRARRVNAYVLGGMRVLPGVAALRELVTGGCLGEVRDIAVTCRQGQLTLEQWDTVRWLRGDGDVTLTNSPEEYADKPWWSCRIAGSKGEATLACDALSGEGHLASTVGGHQRKRDFGRMEPLPAELALLALAARTETKPSLIRTFQEVRQLEGNLKNLSPKVANLCEWH